MHKNDTSSGVRKCGFITIIGETNAGKSTLVNKMVGQKVSITSRKIQTTLDRILGIVYYKNSQIILIDTPGFLRGKSIPNLEKTAWDAFRESDDILFVVDVCKKGFKNSIKLLNKIDKAKKVSLVLNKVDLIHKPKLLAIIESFSIIRNFENIFITSSINGTGVEDIIKYLDSIIPEQEWIYNQDETTDMAFDKYVAEITREHIYHRLHKEIPYRCKVNTIFYEEKSDGSIRIEQNIHVTNKAHKKIVIGDNAAKVKAIGEAAREELSNILEKQVHLFLHVVVDD